MRSGEISRVTRETNIKLNINIDGKGISNIKTGIGFFDHMLTAFARFSMMDLEINCTGDLHVDGHHTVEDVGICMGTALRSALGDKSQINRTAHAYVPMDEALAFAAVDISGRPFLKLSADFTSHSIGTFDTQLVAEFFRALVTNAGITAHINCTGDNSHHMAEAIFKAFGRALRDAVCVNPRETGIPSTKGVLA